MFYIIMVLVMFTLISLYIRTRPDRIVRKKIKAIRIKKVEELIALITAKTTDDLEEIYKKS